MVSKPLIQIITLVAMLGAAGAVVSEVSDTSAWKGLNRMMSAEEFKQAGLDKLNPEELERLDRWLLQFLVHDSEMVVKSDETIRELQKQPIRHRIVGHFRGWDGKTTFTLDNGEVWHQRVPSRYFASLEDPEVEISRNPLGYYELKVVETGRRVGVTRIK